MSDIRQTDNDKSEEMVDQNLEKLNSLSLKEENEVSKDKCTPTLDYLQVPTINEDILRLIPFSS